MKKYDNKVYLKLCAAIRNEEGAQDWLKDNGYRELYEFWEAYQDVEKSFKWLLQNGFPHLAATIDAMSENEKAKLWLMKNGYQHLAFFCDASEGNQSAVTKLLKSGHDGWVAVAKEIYEWSKKKKKKGFWGMFDFGNPFN